MITYDKAQNPLTQNIAILRNISPPLISDLFSEETISIVNPEIRVDYNDVGAGRDGSRL